MRKQQEIAKRAFDIIASSAGLVLLSPLLLFIAAAIKIEDGGPVLFSQNRVGRDFVPFRLYKFRTMVTGAEKSGPEITAECDERITRIGKILRRNKLDELPQLVNVLRGDMSMVGPRPEVDKYVRLFLDDYREVLTIRPGITDYAAVEFRDEELVLSRYNDLEEGYINDVLPKKIKLYRKYINERSICLDIGIIIKTLAHISKKSDLPQDSS